MLFLSAVLILFQLVGIEADINQSRISVKPADQSLTQRSFFVAGETVSISLDVPGSFDLGRICLSRCFLSSPETAECLIELGSLNFDSISDGSPSTASWLIPASEELNETHMNYCIVVYGGNGNDLIMTSDLFGIVSDDIVAEADLAGIVSGDPPTVTSASSARNQKIKICGTDECNAFTNEKQARGNKYFMHMFKHLQASVKQAEGIDALKLTKSSHVAIAGGGISGLFIGMMLRDMGIKYTLLEANNRFGGRVFTSHFEQYGGKHYAELGAMRLPFTENSEHQLVYDLVEELNSRRMKRAESMIELVDFQFSGSNGRGYFYDILDDNGDVPLMQYVSEHPEKFAIAPETLIRKWNTAGYYSPGEIMELAMKPFVEAHSVDPDGDNNFLVPLLQKFDHMSTRDYLSQELGVTSDMIDFFELVDQATDILSVSFTEQVFDAISFGSAKWKTVKNGMSRLVEALVHENDPTSLFLNSKVFRIAPVSNGRVAISHVNENEGGQQVTQEFDYVFVTTPIGVVRAMDIEGLTPQTQAAIATLKYDHSCKVYSLFSKQWWKSCGRPMNGVTSMTSLPIRKVVIPNNDDDADEPGVICSSYTWAQDAEHMESYRNSKDMDMRILMDLKKMHPECRDEIEHTYLGSQFRQFSTEEYCRGAYALFGPRQFKQLFGELIKPQLGGRLYFAGEHMDVYHAWIVGALNSSIRSVVEFLKIGKASRSSIISIVHKWPNWDHTATEWVQSRKRYRIKAVLPKLNIIKKCFTGSPTI